MNRPVEPPRPPGVGKPAPEVLRGPADDGPPPVEPLDEEARRWLRQTMPSYAVTVLRRMGQRLGLGTSTQMQGLSREQLCQLLPARLAEPEVIYRQLRSLEPVPAAVLAEAAQADHPITRRWLVRKVLNLTGHDAAPGQGYHIKDKAWDQLVELFVRGLAWFFPEAGEGRHIDVSGLYVPDEGAVWLHPYVRQWLGSRVEGVADPLQLQRVVEGRPEILLHDVCAILASVRDEPLALTAQRRLRQRDEVRLVRQGLGPPAGFSPRGWVAFVLQLALAAKLVNMEPDKRLVVSPSAEAFIRLPVGQQLLTLFAAYGETEWMEVQEISELSFDLAGQVKGNGVGPGHCRRARSAVLSALDRWKDGAWHSPTEILRYLAQRDPGFLLPIRVRPATSSWTWDTSPILPEVRPREGGVLRLDESWHEVEGRFVGRMLVGPLAALGVVDVDWDGAESRPRAFRITQIGRRLLAGELPDVQAVAGDRSRPAGYVLPSGEVVLDPARVSTELVDRIRLFTERVKADQVLQFRITERSVRAALAQGVPHEEMQAALTEVAGQELPPNVAYQLADWARRAGRVQVRDEVTVIDSLEPKKSTADRGPAATRLAMKPVAAWHEAIDYRLTFRNLRASVDGSTLELAMADGSPPDWEVEKLLAWLGAEPAGAGVWQADLRRWRDQDEANRPAKRWTHKPAEAGDDVPPPPPRDRVDAVLAILASRLSQGQVPEEIRLALQGWGEARAPLGVAGAALITAPSPAWLDALLRTRAAPLVRGRLDERTFVVAATDLPALRELLASWGWMMP